MTQPRPAPRPAPRLAGVELGGTKTILVLAEGQTIVEQVAIPTEAPEITLPAASAVLRRWNDAAPIAALGIASFGPLDLAAGTMLPTPKPHWSGAAVRAALADGLACPVAIDTDVNGAALAEYRWGAGAAQGFQSLCYITIGTGLGGGVVIDGRAVHGAMHPEIGHVRVRRAAGDTFAGTCRFHGDCIEGLVSGPALAARFGMPGEQVPADHPTWAYVATEIADLVATLFLITSVEAVLIGGGIGIARAALLPQVRTHLLASLGGYLPFLTPETVETRVTVPALGGKAGPLGAIALALDALG
ncbi:ROK family protein [Novosphingobium sp. KCTC 2891]|uniref:ROK family protein n=1 Tax=Novosphingobium sp. KCTC 2891 TaxID=2989730 RepID=UPI00222141E4|nr:ROK family protein [Novosphingobium sp. KCTC 2891]MCW1381927.1 ROK family protein [Novosphingobium sp. KCTC 2891]